MATLRDTLRRSSISLSLVLLAACSGGSDGADSGEASAILLEVSDPNFNAPRAAIHDPVADVYLMSNMVGGELEADEIGYISIIAPDGAVQNPGWIRTTAQVLLHAPKGLAILGDTILVADLDCVRFYSRTNGESLGGRCMDGVASLNGVAVASDGSIFVSESGLSADGSNSGTPAVYRLSAVEGQPGSTVGIGDELGTPRGIDVGSRGIFVATTDPGQILQLTGTGGINTVTDPAGEAFQGVVFTNDGGFAFTSSANSAIYHVNASGQPRTIVEGIGTPGDLGYDATRNRLLVPITDRNVLLVLGLD